MPGEHRLSPRGAVGPRAARPSAGHAVACHRTGTARPDPREPLLPARNPAGLRSGGAWQHLAPGRGDFASRKRVGRSRSSAPLPPPRQLQLTAGRSDPARWPLQSRAAPRSIRARRDGHARHRPSGVEARSRSSTARNPTLSFSIRRRSTIVTSCADHLQPRFNSLGTSGRARSPAWPAPRRRPGGIAARRTLGASGLRNRRTDTTTPAYRRRRPGRRPRRGSACSCALRQQFGAQESASCCSSTAVVAAATTGAVARARRRRSNSSLTARRARPPRRCSTTGIDGRALTATGPPWRASSICRHRSRAPDDGPLLRPRHRHAAAGAPRRPHAGGAGMTVALPRATVAALSVPSCLLTASPGTNSGERLASQEAAEFVHSTRASLKHAPRPCREGAGATALAVDY